VGLVTLTPQAGVAAAEPGTEPPPTRVVPVRRYGRWVAAAVLAVVVAQLVVGLATNSNLHWSVIGHQLFTHVVLTGVLRTLELTILAMAIGVVLGTLIAIGRLSANPVVSGVCWGYVWLFRGTPVLVQIVLWYNIAAVLPRIGFGVPFGGPQLVSVDSNTAVTLFTAAVLGLGLNEAAYMSEVVRAGLLSVDEGQSEAAAALGMRRGLVLRRIVLPQAARVVIPPTGNEVISMLKTTSLVTVISLRDLFGTVQNIAAATFQVIPLLMVAVLWYLAMTSVLSVGQYFLERRFARGSSRALPLTPYQRLALVLSPRRPATPAVPA